MATSGSVDYNLTRNQIIFDAYQLIEVYGVGRTVSDEDMALANRVLNNMIKTWQTQGLHLWGTEEAYLFLTANSASYTLGNAATDAYITSADDAVLTQTNGTHAASATSITVDSTTGMAASDNIGIVLSDKTTHWTTISSVDSSTTLTIASGLASASADNAHVYTFTSRIAKPLRILNARRASGTIGSETEIPMMAISRENYFNLPSKKLSGIPTHYYYNPDLTSGKFYIWPTADTTASYITLTYERQLEDFDAASNTPDFPSEWLEAIVYQLAIRLAPYFGKIDKKMAITAEASEILNTVMSWDNEVTSIKFGVKRR